MLEDGLYPKDWKKYSISECEIETEYKDICECFDSLGWHHYEISNWARPGYECEHNLGYWDHSNYRGFGLSATSYIDGERFENSHSFA
jgi:coproporphyrinogen III oxidase-like Fe-S oxidoreductase